MPTSRRDLLKSALTSAAFAIAPTTRARHAVSPSELHTNYAKLDAAFAPPVFKRELFPNPVIIDSIELLRFAYKKRSSFLCRIRSKDGAIGIAVSNSQQMESLYPIFVKRIAPFFLGKDARDIESLLEEVTVYENNYKATGLAIFVPIATIEFAILDLFGKLANRSHRPPALRQDLQPLHQRLSGQRRALHYARRNHRPPPARHRHLPCQSHQVQARRSHVAC